MTRWPSFALAPMAPLPHEPFKGIYLLAFFPVMVFISIGLLLPVAQQTHKEPDPTLHDRDAVTPGIRAVTFQGWYTHQP